MSTSSSSSSSSSAAPPPPSSSSSSTLVVEWTCEFDERFAAIHARLSAQLRAAAVDVVAVEHVGSTSVRALAAKPIIDVDIVVADERDIEAVVAALASTYEHRGTLGVPQRHALRARDVVHGELSGGAQNVYVTVAGCVSLRNHIAVRDTLRRDDALRAEYARVKRELSARTGNLSDYCAAKSDVVRRILCSSDTPFTDDELDGIFGLNTSTQPSAADVAAQQPSLN